jgi:hypothetical protein
MAVGLACSCRHVLPSFSAAALLTDSRDDEPFTSYKTSQYHMHLYETLTGYKFVLLSDPGSDSLRFVLRQIHTGPFVDYVVRNPLIEMDSRTRGIDNDQVSEIEGARRREERQESHNPRCDAASWRSLSSDT